MIMKPSMKYMRVLGWILIALLYLTLLGNVCVKYPSNHGGGTSLYWWGGLFVAAFNVFELMKSKTMSILRLCFIFSFGVILMACDHFNVLIEYETWIARGMPVWGSLAVSPVGN